MFTCESMWKKLKKNKEKKEKGAWQNKRFCDTFFFACGALEQSDANKLVFEIKGKGKKKKPKSEIFGKEISVEQRMKKEVDKAMNSCFIVIFSKGQRS